MFAGSEHACEQWHSSRESTALTVAIINIFETMKAEDGPYSLLDQTPITSIVDMLLAAGANPNTCNVHGVTPLLRCTLLSLCD
jgi:hypothetical protein